MRKGIEQIENRGNRKNKGFEKIRNTEKWHYLRKSNKYTLLKTCIFASFFVILENNKRRNYNANIVSAIMEFIRI